MEQILYLLILICMILRVLCFQGAVPENLLIQWHYFGMYIPLSDDKHQMVRDSSKKNTGQCGRNSNPVATLPHAAVVFRIQPFN